MSEKTNNAWRQFSKSVDDVMDGMFEDVEKASREAKKDWKTDDNAGLRFTAHSVRSRFKIAYYFFKRAAETLAKGTTTIQFRPASKKP